MQPSSPSSSSASSSTAMSSSIQLRSVLGRSFDGEVRAQFKTALVIFEEGSISEYPDRLRVLVAKLFQLEEQELHPKGLLGAD